MFLDAGAYITISFALLVIEHYWLLWWYD